LSKDIKDCKDADTIMISYDLLIYNAGSLLISLVNTCILRAFQCVPVCKPGLHSKQIILVISLIYFFFNFMNYSTHRKN